MQASFAYEVHLVDRKPGEYDHTDGLVGGGHITRLADGEEGFVKATQIWQRHFPGREIHVTEITAEEFTSGVSQTNPKEK